MAHFSLHTPVRSVRRYEISPSFPELFQHPSYHTKELKTATVPEKKVLFLSENTPELQPQWKNKHTSFCDSAVSVSPPHHRSLWEPCLTMLIFLVYISEPEASAKICVYVFILMRVFIQIYFWVLFTRSEELWLFPLHTDLKTHRDQISLLSYQNLFRGSQKTRKSVKLEQKGFA